VSAPAVLYSKEGHVATVVMNRPEVKNALNGEMLVRLADAWQDINDDGSIRVAILTGAGDDAFCAGGDLKDAFAGEHVVPVSPAERDAHARGERPGILGPTRWTDLVKPTIAAVNGVAYAGGLEWACWTDLCVADEHATFGVTCRRWNIGLGDGGTQRLPRIVGFRVAMELIITGRVIDAHEAQRIGLVNEVVPRGTCRARAVELAHAIVALPQPAIHTDKEAAVRGFGRPLDEGLRIEAECFNRLLDGVEMAEGLRRFNERDHPDRRGGDGTTPGLSRPRRG
jgi:enoyl-CoA hydratase/carnithine racemase